MEASQLRAGASNKLALVLALTDSAERAKLLWRLVQGALNKLGDVQEAFAPTVA